MATGSKKDPSEEGLAGAGNTGAKKDHHKSSEELTETPREKKRRLQRESLARKKGKMISTEHEVGELKEKCAYFKGQVDLLEKQVKRVRNKVKKQSAEAAKLWEQIDGHAQEEAELLELHAQEMAAAAALHAQEMAAAAALHAQEMAAAAARHAQEMAAAEVRHAQEMAAAEDRHAQELGNMGQPPAEDSLNFDIDEFLVADETLGCSSAAGMKNVVWAP